MNIKKVIALLMVLMMTSFVFLCSCSASESEEPDSQSEPAEDVQPDADEDSAATKYLPVKADFYDYDPDNTEEYPSAEEIHCSYEYTYDEHGNMVSCHKHEEVSEMDDTYENSYRDDGTLEKVKAKIASDPYEDGEIVYEEYTFDFDDSGKIINDPNPMPDDAKIKYADDGLMNHAEYEDEDGLGKWDYDYTLNDDGLVTKVIKHYEHDEYYVYVFTYDTGNKNTEVTAGKYAEFINGIWNNLSAW